MKFGEGSSRYLVLAACVFREDEHVDEAASAINACRDSLKRGLDWEFKHAKTSADFRDAFFECTKRLKYYVRAMIIDKTRLYSDALIRRHGYLQNYAIKEIFVNTKGTVKDAKLVIDGEDRRAFGLKSTGYFLREVNEAAPGTLRKVEYNDSLKNPLIQLADMTAGAIHRRYANPEKANPKHFAMIKGRTSCPEGSLWQFPRPSD